MPKMQPNLCKLLVHREGGFKDCKNQLELCKTTQSVNEDLIASHNYFPKSVDNITDSSRSIFAIEFSHDGSLAAISHTNRTVSLIKVANMKKISEIHLDDRTVWTMDFHPSDKNYLATGTFAGRVSIHHKNELFRTFQNHTVKPITSLSFHPLNPYLCFAVENLLYVWDFENDRLINEPLKCGDCRRIRYVKFNPFNDTLITGISKSPNLDFSIYPQQQNELNLHFLMHTFLCTVNFLLEHLETFASATSCLDNSESKPHIWNYLIKFIIDAGKERIRLPMVDSDSVEFQLWDINASLEAFVRRLDIIARSSSTFDFDSHRLEKYMKNLDGIMVFFKKINDMLLKDFDNAGSYVRFCFDEVHIQTIIRTMYGLMYMLNKDDVIKYDLNFYLDDAEFFAETHLTEVALSRPTEYRKEFSLQVWDFDVDQQLVPRLINDWSNVITTCSIHNDSTLSLSNCGTRIAAYKTGFFAKTIEIRSLEAHNLGELLHSFEMELPFVSLSLSPTGRYLLLGVRCFQHYGLILKIEPHKKKMTKAMMISDPDDVIEINCAKFAPNACDGILIGHKNYFLRYINYLCQIQD